MEIKVKKKKKIVWVVAKYFSFLIYLKQFLLAWFESTFSLKNSYSQHKEDAYIFNQLHEVNLKQGIYIDVGANQPTRLSNTFLFYKRKCYGIVIEPNSSMKSLFRIFRPKDIFLSVGAGAKESVEIFKKSSTSVLSGFSSEIDSVISYEYVPVIALDSLLPIIGNKFIYLLSIDTEGYDIFVLQGASKILQVTLYVIVETNSDAKDLIDLHMEKAGFVKQEVFGCNSIYMKPENIAKLALKNLHNAKNDY